MTTSSSGIDFYPDIDDDLSLARRYAKYYNSLNNNIPTLPQFIVYVSTTQQTESGGQQIHEFKHILSDVVEYLQKLTIQYILSNSREIASNLYNIFQNFNKFVCFDTILFLAMIQYINEMMFGKNVQQFISENSSNQMLKRKRPQNSIPVNNHLSDEIKVNNTEMATETKTLNDLQNVYNTFKNNTQGTVMNELIHLSQNNVFLGNLSSNQVVKKFSKMRAEKWNARTNEKFTRKIDTYLKKAYKQIIGKELLSMAGILQTGGNLPKSVLEQSEGSRDFFLMRGTVMDDIEASVARETKDDQIFNTMLQNYQNQQNLDKIDQTYLTVFARLILLNSLTNLYLEISTFISPATFIFYCKDLLKKLLDSIGTNEEEYKIKFEAWINFESGQFEDNSPFLIELKQWITGSKSIESIIGYRLFDLMVQQQEFQQLPKQTIPELIHDQKINNYKYVSKLTKTQEVREFFYITDHNQYSFFDSIQMSETVPFTILGEYVKMKLEFRPPFHWYNQNSLQTVNQKNDIEIIAKIAYTGKSVPQIVTEDHDKLYLTVSIRFESEWDIITSKYTDINEIKEQDQNQRNREISNIEKIRNDKKSYRMIVRVVLKTPQQIQLQDEIRKRIETCFVTPLPTPTIIPSLALNTRYTFCVLLQKPLNIVILKDLITNNPTLSQFFQINDQTHFLSKTKMRVFFFTYVPFFFERINDLCQCSIEQGKLFTKSVKIVTPQDLVSHLTKQNNQFEFIAQVSIRTNIPSNAVQFQKMFQKLITVYFDLEEEYQKLYTECLNNNKGNLETFWAEHLYKHVIRGYDQNVNNQQKLQYISNIQDEIHRQEQVDNVIFDLTLDNIISIVNELETKLIYNSESNYQLEYSTINEKSIEHWKNPPGTMKGDFSGFEKTYRPVIIASLNNSSFRIEDLFNQNTYIKLQKFKLDVDSKINSMNTMPKQQQQQDPAYNKEKQTYLIYKEKIAKYLELFQSTKLFPRENDVYVGGADDQDYPRYVYSCSNQENHKFIGLKKNSNAVQSHKEKYPLLPYCYMNKKKQSQLFDFYYDKENSPSLVNVENEKDRKGTYVKKESSQCSPENYGEVPLHVHSLLMMSELVQQSQPKLYNEYYRLGIKQSFHTFFYAVAQALGLNSEEQITKKKSQLKELIRNSCSNKNNTDDTSIFIINNNNKTVPICFFQDSMQQDLLTCLDNERMYMDPTKYLTFMEYLFQCHIFVFRRTFDHPNGVIAYPQYHHQFLKFNYNFEKFIIIVEHSGSLSMRLYFPRCEIIQRKKPDKTHQSVFHVNVDSDKKLFELLTSAVNQTFKVKMFPLIQSFLPNCEIYSCLVDLTGATRAIYVKHDSFSQMFAIVTDPLPNIFNVPSNMFSCKEIKDNLVLFKFVNKFANEVFQGNDIQILKKDQIVYGLQVNKQDCLFTLPCVPFIHKKASISNSSFPFPIFDDFESSYITSIQSTKRRFSKLLMNYIMYGFSRFLKIENKSVPDTENDRKNLASVFINKCCFQVSSIQNQYDLLSVYKELFVNSDKIFWPNFMEKLQTLRKKHSWPVTNNSNELLFPLEQTNNEEMEKRIHYFLTLMMERNKNKFEELFKTSVITDFYQDVDDFFSSSNPYCNFLKGRRLYNQFISANDTDFTSFSKVVSVSSLEVLINKELKNDELDNLILLVVLNDNNKSKNLKEKIISDKDNIFQPFYEKFKDNKQQFKFSLFFVYQYQHASLSALFNITEYPTIIFGKLQQPGFVLPNGVIKYAKTTTRTTELLMESFFTFMEKTELNFYDFCANEIFNFRSIISNKKNKQVKNQLQKLKLTQAKNPGQTTMSSEVYRDSTKNQTNNIHVIAIE